jgi:hypothetical protein
MKKIRCYLAAIALAAALSGPFFLQAMGSGSMANAASSHYASSVSAPSVVGKSTRSEAIIRPPCGLANDC